MHKALLHGEAEPGIHPHTLPPILFPLRTLVNDESIYSRILEGNVNLSVDSIILNHPLQKKGLVFLFVTYEVLEWVVRNCHLMVLAF